MDYTGCYYCGKKILEESQSGQQDSMGRRVTPSPDYTCVGVRLYNGKDMVEYATQVCKRCCKRLVYGVLRKCRWEKLKDNLIKAVKEQDFGPRYLYENQPTLSVVTVRDLTEELRQNKVI